MNAARIFLSSEQGVNVAGSTGMSLQAVSGTGSASKVFAGNPLPEAEARKSRNFRRGNKSYIQPYDG